MFTRQKICFVFILFCVWTSSAQTTRPAKFAGSFYPENPEKLSSQIDLFLNHVPELKISENEILGLIVPHAGYIYSGKTAAYGFSAIKGKNYPTVIIIGRSHHSFFKGAIIDNRNFWETPLGKVELDHSLFKTLYKYESFHLNEYLLDVEHSLEVEVPFLQKTLRKFKIFPVLLGDFSTETLDTIAKNLFDALKDKKNVLFIASTDLSHYHPLKIAQKKDTLLLNFLEKGNMKLIMEKLQKREAEMCGNAAVILLFKIAEKFGPYEVKILHYSTSADTTGDKTNVVGYGSAVISKTTKNIKKGGGMLSEEQKKKLLHIARETLEYYLSGKKLPDLNIEEPALKEKRGVFVTLKKGGNLKGCIGYIMPVEPLAEAVRKMAIQSATADPRFSPVSYKELKDIEIEISALTVPKRVKDAGEIVLRRDGVIVKKGFNQGVFLPQVADETGWSKEEFLNNLCAHKAGLSPDAWQDPDTELYTFQAEVFSENE